MAKWTRNLRKIRVLLYIDNMTQYLIEFQDLNNVVRLGGQVIKELITRTIPEKLIKLVYSCYSTVPLDYLKFNIAIRDAGLTYKSFIL